MPIKLSLLLRIRLLASFISTLLLFDLFTIESSSIDMSLVLPMNLSSDSFSERLLRCAGWITK